MVYSILADLLVVVHILFIMFVVFGAALALRWPRLIPIHLLAVIWGVFVELAGWTCPLTPMENWARHQAGQSGYSGGFVEQYLVPLIYPDGLTRNGQVVLGLLVLLLNLIAYWTLIKRRRGASKPD